MEKLNVAILLVPLLCTLWVLRELLGRLWRAEERTPPPKQPLERADFWIAAFLAVAFYLLAIWRLGTPTQMVFDEVHHVRTAMEYIRGEDPHEWTHPPLAKLIMAASMKLWGSSFDPRDGVWTGTEQFASARTPIGWRFPAVVFGALALIALYALTRALFDNRTIATAATLLLALDGIFFVHSRIGMTNIYTVCFLLSGTLGTWLYIKRRSGLWLLLTGVSLGLALATRWSSLWAWGFNGLLLLWDLVAQQWPRWREEKRPLLWHLIKWTATVGAATVALPLLLYLLSYVPFVLQGEGSVAQKLFTPGEPGPVDWTRAWSGEARAFGHGWYKVLEQQADMWNYHTGLKEGHPYWSPWWSWPLLLRPTWYHFESENGQVSGIWSIGNAFLWWASVPGLIAAVYLAGKERQAALGAAAFLGFGMWLCWAIKPRPLIFMHYFFEAIPFVCITLAYIGWRLWETRDEGNRFFVSFYSGLIGFWFVFYYPLLSALAIPDWYFRLHLWLENIWI